MSTHFEISMRLLTSTFALSLLLAIPFAQTADAAAKATPQRLKVTRQDIAAKTPVPLNLKLSEAELDTLMAKYGIRAGDARDAHLDEIVVSSATELLPMRSDVNDAWAGLFAPMWAVLHPTQSWRVFLPIPAQ